MVLFLSDQVSEKADLDWASAWEVDGRGTLLAGVSHFHASFGVKENAVLERFQ